MPRIPKSELADLPAIAPELLESFCNGPMTAEAINAASGAQVDLDRTSARGRDEPSSRLSERCG